MKKIINYSAQYKVIQLPMNTEGALRENENHFHNNNNNYKNNKKGNYQNKTKNL